MKWVEIIEKMTLDEKASLCSGLTFWDTKPVERLKVSKISMSDGPYGIRKQNDDDHYLDFHTSKKFICFPTAAGMAASFSKELWHEFGKTLGRECRAEGVDVLLGPALNIKRSPLGGRNFEYLSEDPLLSGSLASEYVKGLQEEGTSACVKHFAANNQETRRMSSSSNIDERTLHEIYLSNFEKVIKEAKPDTIMCSYNQINHTFVSENKWLLTQLLRDEWGFDGTVVTDWGAICDRVKGLVAGVDLEMPSSGGITDKQIVEAVKSNQLDEKLLDKAVLRILKLISKHKQKECTHADYANDHEIARKFAEESIVLLKNERDLLPLPNRQIKVAFIGDFAENPRYEGGGSSHINSWKIDSPVLLQKEWSKIEFSYAKGYSAESEQIDEVLLKNAVLTAASADYAIVFVGLPDSYESESYDRKNLDIPAVHNILVNKVMEAQADTVVVLQNGSPINMPWLSKVPAILESYLGGEGVGGALLDIIFGKVNPSGHLAETFPMRIEDTSCYLNFPGHRDEVNYQEGVFVGYRYFTSKSIPVLFPFGHGLSYTKFAFSKLKVSSDEYMEGNRLQVQILVKNNGNRKGKAVIQLYVESERNFLITERPLRELKAFDKVELKAGEEKVVSLILDERAFSYYDVDIHDWYIAPGSYKIQIASDCNHVSCEKSITATPYKRKEMTISRNTLIGDLLENPRTALVMEDGLPDLLAYMGVTLTLDEDGHISRGSIPTFAYELPIRSLVNFTDGKFTEDHVIKIIKRLKASYDEKGDT